MNCLLRLFLGGFAFLLAVIVLVVGGAWFFGRFAPGYVERTVSSRTGFQLDLGRVDVGVLAGKLEIREASLRHSQEFPDTDMLRLRRALVDFVPSSATGAELRFREIEIDVERLAYVVGQDGRSNVEVFGERIRRRPKRDPAPGAEPAEGRPYRIDRLRVRVGEVVVQDRRGIMGTGVMRHEQRIPVNAEIEAEDVTDLADILEPLLRELRQAGVRELGGLLQLLPGEGWGRAWEGTRSAPGRLRETLRDLLPGRDESDP